MLVLSRRVGERIVVDRNIVIELVQMRGDHVRIAITAPPEIEVDREEIFARRHPGVRLPERGTR
jgi:carbon storage regulator